MPISNYSSFSISSFTPKLMDLLPIGLPLLSASVITVGHAMVFHCCFLPLIMVFSGFSAYPQMCAMYYVPHSFLEPNNVALYG